MNDATPERIAFVDLPMRRCCHSTTPAFWLRGGFFVLLILVFVFGFSGCGLWSDQFAARRLLGDAQHTWRSGNLEGAGRKARGARDLDPTLIEAYLIGSEILFETNQPDLAILELQLGLDASRSADSTDRLSVLLAERLVSQGRGSEAEALLRSRSLGQPRLLPALADLLIRMGRTEEAIETSERYLALAPSSIQADLFHASLLSESGRLEDAVEVLRPHFSLGEGELFIEWLSDMGRSRLTDGYLRLLERLQQEPGIDDEIDLLLAQTCLSLGRGADADSLIQDGLRDFPDSIEWTLLKCIRRLENGDMITGSAILRAVLDRNPVHLQALEIFASLPEMTSEVTHLEVIERMELAIASSQSLSTRDYLIRRLLDLGP